MPLDLFAAKTNKQAAMPLDLFDEPVDLFADDEENVKPALEPTQVDVAMDSVVNRPGNVIDLFGKNQKDLQPVSQDQITEGPAGPQPDAPLAKEAVFGDMPQAVSDQATNQLQSAHDVKQPTVLEALRKSEKATGGLLEAGVTLATVPFGLAAGGAAIAGGMLTPGESMEDVYKTVEKAMSAFIAIPRTKEGKEIIAATLYPLEWMKENGNKLGDNVVKNGLDIVDPETGNTVNVFKGNILAGTIIGSTPELLAYILPLLGRFKNKAIPADAVALSEVVSEAANLRNIARTKGPQSPEYKAAFAAGVERIRTPDPTGKAYPRGTKNVETPKVIITPKAEGWANYSQKEPIVAPEPQGKQIVPEAPKTAPEPITPEVAPVPSAPVVVNARHWSPTKIEGVMDLARLGTMTAQNNPQAVESAKLGAWFTEQETPISDKHTIPNEAKVTMNNPLVLTNENVPAVDVMGEQIKDAKQWLMDEVERAGGGEKLRAELQAKGYDGIVLEDSEFDNAKSYVAFGKDQIELTKALPEKETDHIKAAYDTLKAELGTSNIEIAAIRDRAGVTQAEIESYLRRQSESGRAVTTTGDWSVSGEHTRSGAISLSHPERPDLMARIDEGEPADVQPTETQPSAPLDLFPEETKAAPEVTAPEPAPKEPVKVTPTAEGIKVKADIPKSKEDALSPKEQKKYLLAEIDKAIELAPEEGSGADVGMVVISIPGDGDFRIINNKYTLEAFKKAASKFPASEKIDAVKLSKRASEKPSGGRISGKEIEYYNEFKPRKEGLIERKPEQSSAVGSGRSSLVVKQYYNDGYFSDGNYVVKVGAKPKLKYPVKTGDEAPKLSETVSSFAKSRASYKVKISGEFSKGDSDTLEPFVDVVNKEGTHHFYNSKYVDSILTLHPSAETYLNSDSRGPLIFKVKKEVVGITMPFVETEWSDYLQKRYEELNKPVKERAAEEQPPSGVEAMPAGTVTPKTPTPATVYSKPIPSGLKRSDTLKHVEKVLGLPLRIGKFRGPYAGIYKKVPEVVRLKKANDLATASHEVGHHIQNLIGLGGKMPPEIKAMSYTQDPKRVNREGFAEFIRYYITDYNKVKTEAPAFTKTFEDALDQHPDVSDAITNIKEAWNAWNAATDVQKIASIIRRGNGEKKRYRLNDFYKDWVDELYPVKLLSDAIQRKSNSELRASKDPFLLAWATRGWARKAEQMIKHGTFQMDDSKGVVFTGPSLRSTLKPFERAGQIEELDVYLLAKRAESDPRILKGFEGILTQENFSQAIKDLEPKYKEVADKLYKFQDEILKYLVGSGRISADVADSYRKENPFYAPFYRVMDDAPPGGLGVKKFSEIGNPTKHLKGSSRDVYSPIENMIKNVYAFVNAAERNRVGTAILQATKVQGMGDMIERIPFPLEPRKINKDDFLRLIKKYGDVNAIRNVQTSQTETEKTLSGLGGSITPNEKMIRVAKEALLARGWSEGEVSQILEKIKTAPAGPQRQEIIEKTIEKTVIMTIKEELGFGRMPDDVIHTFRPAYRAGPSEAIFYSNGKPILVEMSTELASAIKGTDAEAANILIRILSLPAKLLRAGATLTPEFVARNPMRDQLTAFIFSKYGYIPGYDLIRGIYHILNVSDLYQTYNASGAAHANMVSLDRNYLSDKLKDIMDMRTPGEAIRSPVKSTIKFITASAKHPLKMMQIISELTEEASRVGGFARALKTEGKGLDALIRAAIESRDMTLDFSRIGAKAKAMNMITAFFNAQVQGTDKMRRAFQERPGKTFLKAFIGITLPSLLLWYAQNDDPYYDEIPMWRRLFCWNIITHNEDGSLKHIWSIPKPFEIGILFGTVPVMALDWMKTKDPSRFGPTMAAVWNGLMPGVVPTFAIPLIENYANRSLFFDRPISPRDTEGLSPYLQYSEKTSETMKLLARGLNEIPLVSDYSNPAKMENVVRGYTGGSGAYLLSSLDKILKSVGAVNVAPAPSMKLADLPLIGGFIQRFPTSNAQSIEDFYKKYQENKRIWEDKKVTSGIRDISRDMRIEGKTPSMKPLEKMMVGMPPDLVMQTEVAQVLTLLRKETSFIRDNMQLTPDQKRNALDSIYIQMTNISRLALGKQFLKQGAK